MQAQVGTGAAPGFCILIAHLGHVALPQDPEPC